MCPVLHPFILGEHHRRHSLLLHPSLKLHQDLQAQVKKIIWKIYINENEII